MEKQGKEEEIRFPISRRDLLNRLWLALGFVAVAEAVWLVVSFLRPRKPRVKEGGLGSVIETGLVDGFTPGTVTAFPRGHFYLARLEDGGFLAVTRTCTHLGCTVQWIEDEKKFTCPCHASAFDIRGNVISAPAPRALDMYWVFIENDVVKVDTRKLIRRTEFREKQVVYPEKI
ncbi:MAG: Rieske 2Fe-2S domain-containing protein [Candidatus Hydrogenedentota bacterium]|nr:MAG: Rieske 2Fe-2S domain-containing protein [Candidatus Hydrogenedentota bacterium]